MNVCAAVFFSSLAFALMAGCKTPHRPQETDQSQAKFFNIPLIGKRKEDVERITDRGLKMYQKMIDAGHARMRFCKSNSYNQESLDFFLYASSIVYDEPGAIKSQARNLSFDHAYLIDTGISYSFDLLAAPVPEAVLGSAAEVQTGKNGYLQVPEELRIERRSSLVPRNVADRLNNRAIVLIKNQPLTPRQKTLLEEKNIVIGGKPVNDVPSSISVIFRGTSNASEVISDLKVWATCIPAYNSGENQSAVHCGFYQAMTELYAYLLPILEPYQEAFESLREQDGSIPRPVLFTAGHSLGGALATLFAGKQVRDLARQKNDYPWKFEALYAFSAPKVGNVTYLDHINEKLSEISGAGMAPPKLFNTYLGNDIVPRIPLGFAKIGGGYFHDLSEHFANLNHLFDESRVVVTENDLSADLFNILFPAGSNEPSSRIYDADDVIVKLFAIKERLQPQTRGMLDRLGKESILGMDPPRKLDIIKMVSFANLNDAAKTRLLNRWTHVGRSMQIVLPSRGPHTSISEQTSDSDFQAEFLDIIGSQPENLGFTKWLQDGVTSIAVNSMDSIDKVMGLPEQVTQHFVFSLRDAMDALGKSTENRPAGMEATCLPQQTLLDHALSRTAFAP